MVWRKIRRREHRLSVAVGAALFASPHDQLE
jgi:hypothetical protein